MKKQEIRPLTNIVRNHPDYYGSYTDSKMLSNRIERYWKNKGYYWVKVWIESEEDVEGRKTHVIRSNLKFNARDAEEGRYV
jgi:hypothetical protein